MTSASGDEDDAPTTGKPKQTNFLSNFEEFYDEEKLCPANFLKEMIKAKNDKHEKRKRLCFIENVRKEFESYTTAGSNCRLHLGVHVSLQVFFLQSPCNLKHLCLFEFVLPKLTSAYANLKD